MVPLRIGMVTLCYKPLINGVIRMIDLYKAELEQLGHEVTVFTLNSVPNDASPAQDVVESFGFPLANSGYYVNWRLDQQAQALMGKMDILHCHHLFVSIGLARKYGNCPVVYTNHTRYDLYTENLLPLSSLTVNEMMQVAWPKACEAADVVIAPSVSVKQIMQQFGVEQPIEVIENGIDQRPFLNPSAPLTKKELGVPETAVLFAYVGRVYKEKNLSFLLSQFALLLTKSPDVHLMLVGDGPEIASLKRQCGRLGIQAQVSFCGAVPYEDVPNYLAAADIFVTASQTEVHPLTLMEAMTMGLPIIAPDAPGNRDIIDHEKTGLLFELAGSNLAMAMQKLANSTKKRQQMAQAALAKRHRYTIERTTRQTIALYDRLRRERPDLQRKKLSNKWMQTNYEKKRP